MGGILVLIVDDASGVRASVRLALSQHPGIAEIIEAKDGPTAVELAKQRRPDVVIMDITLPGMDGHSATREILSALPATRVIMHSAISDPAEVERALANGAVGFVDKGRTHELLPAITAAGATRKR